MDRAIVFGTISWGFESLRTRAPLAQLAEHLALNQRVEGSIPSRRIGSITEQMPELLPLDGDQVNRAGAGIGRQDRLRIYWGYAS